MGQPRVGGPDYAALIESSIRVRRAGLARRCCWLWLPYSHLQILMRSAPARASVTRVCICRIFFTTAPCIHMHTPPERQARYRIRENADVVSDIPPSHEVRCY